MVDVLRADIAAAARRREQPLGVEAERDYLHSTRDESPASHLVVDLLRAAYPDSDVALYNATGTRAPLTAGPMTYGDVYALLPFDSVVATATLPASTIADAILRGVTRGPIPIVSGIEADVSCDGQAPRVTLSRAGTPLPPDTPLRLVTNEFVASGGAGYFPDMERRFVLRLDEPMRESVVSVLKGEAPRPVGGGMTGRDVDGKRIRVPGNTYPVRCR